MDTMLTSEAATTSEGQAQAQAATSTQAEGQTAPAGEQAAQAPAQGQAQAQGEQQAAQGQPAEGQQGEQQAAPKAPEKYEFKAGDGQTYDAEVMGAFADAARELDLSQDDAQKVLDKVAPVMAARQAQALEAMRNEWTETSRSDKEFGGDKLPENLAVAKKAMDQFGTPELRTLLNESGLGNHPEVIRLLYRAGKAISEDASVVTGGRSTPLASAAQRMYPGMNP